MGASTSTNQQDEASPSVDQIMDEQYIMIKKGKLQEIIKKNIGLNIKKEQRYQAKIRDLGACLSKQQNIMLEYYTSKKKSEERVLKLECEIFQLVQERRLYQSRNNM